MRETLCDACFPELFYLYLQDEIVALRKQNDSLCQEVEQLISELEYWETRNGCKLNTGLFRQYVTHSL